MEFIDYLIESNKRVAGKITNFRVNLAASVKAEKIELKYIQLPNVFYNVRTNYNDLVPLSTGDVTIPEGSYNINELVTQLTTTLSSTTTYNPITMRLNFASSLTFNWASTTNANLANRVLGFLDLNDITTTKSPYAPNLSNEPFLLHIKGVNGRTVGYDQGYATFLINPNVDKTMIIENTYEYGPPTLKRPNNNIYQLEVSLTQTDGAILPANLFLDYYFVLRIYHNAS
jgi:hypothetical protein